MSFFPIVDADASNKGLVQLAGDLSGTASSPSVPALSQKIDASEKGAVGGVAEFSHTHTASQISDATTVGQEVMTATDQAAAQLALGIANTVQVVDSFAEVTTPVYGTLYVVRS